MQLRFSRTAAMLTQQNQAMLDRRESGQRITDIKNRRPITLLKEVAEQGCAAAVSARRAS